MKTQSPTALQFTGYPLTVASNQLNIHKLSLIAVQNENKTVKKDAQVNKMVNDPDNWDDDWFSHYE